MIITVFSKKGTTQDGKKQFDRYMGRLTKKDGTELTVAIKFREECGNPKTCPCNIVVDKKDANLSDHEYTREDTGEVVKSYTLWISKWKLGEPYVDHSLDDFVN